MAMPKNIYKGNRTPKTPISHLVPVARDASPPSPVTTVEEALAAGFVYFMENPDESELIRPFVPGEFRVANLPAIPERQEKHFEYATLVTVEGRINGEPVYRHRQLILVSDLTHELLDLPPGAVVF